MTPVSPSVVITQNMAITSISHELQPEEVSVSKDKTNFKDGDDFFLFFNDYTCCSPGTLKKETIAQLSKDYPGIFDGLDEPDDLFRADPIRYQPLAKLIYDVGDTTSILNETFGYPSQHAKHMTYGIYKGGFYSIEEDHNGRETIKIHKDHYQMARENKLFVSQLREFLFDESQTGEYKLRSLKMLFPPLQDGEEDITIKKLRENMDFLFGSEFKMAQQRAMAEGFNP